MNKFKNSFALTKRSAKILAIFTLLACGPGMVDYDEFMSFFMPESTNATTNNQRYNYTAMLFYNENENEYPTDSIDLCRIENIKAWQQYCQGKVTDKDIERGIYQSIVNSKLGAYLKVTKNQAALQYLQLCQLVDKIYTTDNTDYFQQTNIDTTLLESTTQKAVILAQQSIKTTDDFLKERFGFQAIKLLSISKKHQDALKAYQEFIVPIKTKSFISDWALMRKAESETALNNVNQAYYDFAQVFDRSPSHRKQADLVARTRIDSFTVTNAVLDLCKNNHEKAAIYAFAGIKPTTDALPMLEKMVEFEPNNNMIELIMAREINRNEKFYYDQSYGYNYYDSSEDSLKMLEARKEAGNYWTTLKDFTIKCADNPMLPKTGFWEVATAYMEYIEHDFTKAEHYLTQAKAIKTANEGLKNQILLQELLLVTKSTPHITPAVETKFLPLLEKMTKPKNFRVSNALVESCKILSANYLGVSGDKQNATKSGGWLSSCSSKSSNATVVPYAVAKAYLMTMLATRQVNSADGYGNFEAQKDMFALEDTTSLATIEQVITYYSENNKSDFDKRLQQLVGFDNDHLFTLMGRRAMDENNYAKAAEAFEKVSPNTWKSEEWKLYFNEDPFFISPKFKVEMPNLTYTPYTFAKKMAELVAKLTANPNDFQSAYLLGCGAYNTTWHGNAWYLRRHGWSGSEVSSYSLLNTNTDYYQATIAKTYFTQALKTQHPEMAAKACFGAALCEKVAFDVFTLQQSDQYTEEALAKMAVLRKEKYSHYFSLLKTKYQNTQYQRQVLAECADYSLFSGK